MSAPIWIECIKRIEGDTTWWTFWRTTADNFGHIAGRIRLGDFSDMVDATDFAASAERGDYQVVGEVPRVSIRQRRELEARARKDRDDAARVDVIQREKDAIQHEAEGCYQW